MDGNRSVKVPTGKRKGPDKLQPATTAVPETGEWAYLYMTALAWVRCAWDQHLFPAALPRTAALQSQTGNPWCWSATGWPPDQGALTTPDQSPEMSDSRWGSTSLETPSARARKVEVPGRKEV